VSGEQSRAVNVPQFYGLVFPARARVRGPWDNGNYRLSGAVQTLDKKKPTAKSREGAKTISAETARPVGRAGSPGWANGLRQLYDSVVDEPLPDNFKDLLSKLDSKN
jgi:hypothetical protein